MNALLLLEVAQTQTENEQREQKSSWNLFDMWCEWANECMWWMYRLISEVTRNINMYRWRKRYSHCKRKTDLSSNANDKKKKVRRFCVGIELSNVTAVFFLPSFSFESLCFSCQFIHCWQYIIACVLHSHTLTQAHTLTYIQRHRRRKTNTHVINTTSYFIFIFYWNNLFSIKPKQKQRKNSH